MYVFSYRDMVIFKCDSCSFTHVDFRAFSNHLRRHERDPYFVQSCQFCDRVFHIYRTWQRHVSVHIARRQDPDHSNVHADSRTDSEDYSDKHSEIAAQSTENMMYAEPAAEPASCAEFSEPESEDHVADFLIKLRARSIPMNICMDIVKEVHR